MLNTCLHFVFILFTFTQQLIMNKTETTMGSKTVSMRLESELQKMLGEISEKPSLAAQTAVEVLLWMRRATIHELKGLFTTREIVAMAGTYNGFIPTWQIMCNPDVFVSHMEDAEKYSVAITANGVDAPVLIEKLKNLTSAQATILQLELWSYWAKSPRPVLESLVKTLA
jgi:hypothetical protein